MSFPENRILQIAHVCYDANRAWCFEHDEVKPTWEKASKEDRGCMVEAVRFHLDNPLAGDAGAHNIWMNQKVAEGWVWGKVEDAVVKTHPGIVQFHLLPPEQQAKDRLLVSIVRSLSRV